MSTKEQILQRYFGYNEFRAGQGELIEAVLNRQDVLGIMPTGAGKSVCYQVPALMQDNLTLVISPLISLMKDQVHNLKQHGIHAVYLNSTMSKQEYGRSLYEVREGRCKILYLAPERLWQPGFLNFIAEQKISLIVVDEAHCIAQWGQDFRPSYLKIKNFVEQLPVRPVVAAFTATATPAVKQEIIERLSLADVQTVITGFARPNLNFSVVEPASKERYLKNWLEAQKGSGIIYCATRRQTETVCIFLQNAGYKAVRYHAGLSSEERLANQNAFINNSASIIVATNAFGMGIDKPDVRFVVHYSLPLDVESYYQEAGRAGRDGLAATCLLMFDERDLELNQYLLEQSSWQQPLKAEERHRLLAKNEERLAAMHHYCEIDTCLSRWLLRYFGQESKACGKCSNCKQMQNSFWKKL